MTTANGELSLKHLRADGLLSEVVSESADLKAIRHTWDQVSEIADHASLCVSWPWAYAWWTTYGKGRELSLVVFYDGQNPVGLLPLVTTRIWRFPGIPVRQVKWLGGDYTSGDYMDCLVSSDHANHISQIVSQHLFLSAGSRAWDEILLYGTRQNSAFAEICQAIEPRRFRTLATPCEVCPVLRLPDSWDALLSGVRKSTRNNYQYQMRRLNREFALTISKVDDEAALDVAMDRFFSLHASRWKTKGEQGNFTDPRKREFYRKLARTCLSRRSLRLFELKLDTTVVASLFGISCDNRFFFLQSGSDPAFRKYSVGQLLLGHAIRLSIEEGLKSFEFMRGREKYKYDWGAKDVETVCLKIRKRSLKGVLLRAMDYAEGGCRRIVRWMRGALQSASPPTSRRM